MLGIGFYRETSLRGVSLLVLTLLLSFPIAADGGLTRYFIGSSADAEPVLHGPAFDLGGGGSDVDEAMQWVIDQVRGCDACEVALDVVVLRSSGSDGYNEWFELLDGIDSIETFVVTDRPASLLPAVANAVRQAEVVFFAGGDQCNYVRYFKDTPVQTAVESVVARGGGVGGTSAGLAIQGELTYDACAGGSTVSADALADPYHWDISISDGFFQWQFLRDTITDTHFLERDRLGRLIVFMARSLATGEPGETIRGIGVDARTSLTIDRLGLARVMGSGPVYFLRGTAPVDTLERTTPLTWRDIELWVVDSGGTFDLARWPEQPPRTMSVVEGSIVEAPGRNARSARGDEILVLREDPVDPR